MLGKNGTRSSGGPDANAALPPSVKQLQPDPVSPTPHCVVVTAWLVRSWRAVRATLNGGGFITGAELRRYGKPHTSLRQGRERAEQFGGWQRAEPRALRSAGVVGGRISFDRRKPHSARHPHVGAAAVVCGLTGWRLLHRQANGDRSLRVVTCTSQGSSVELEHLDFPISILDDDACVCVRTNSKT